MIPITEVDAMETKDVILELRTKRGLSQDDLAEKVMVTRQAVSRWENGDTVPNTDTLKLLSKEFDVSINTLLGEPRKLICQCCGMPLEDDAIMGRDSDGALNEDYCKWCYADGTYTYSNMDDLIDVCVKNMVGENFTEEQARAYLKEILPKLDYWKRYEQLSDGGQFEAFKEQLIDEINALHIEGMPRLERLNALVGKYVNLEYRLPNGMNVRFLDDEKTYLGNQLSGVPFVCVERNILGSGIDSVEFRDREAIFKGADYLLASGHKNVLFFRESTDSTTRDERTKGFLNALEKYNINTNDANIVDVTLEKGEDDCMLAIQKALRRYRPTAVLAGGNRITLYLMKTLRDMGIDCPGEISVVGFGDESWSELTYPPLTILRRDVKGLSAKAVGMLFEKINTGVAISHDCYADVELVVRKSTKMLDNGPFGDKAAAPDSVVLTKEEKHRLKAGHYRVAISFHYTGTSWAELHEKGIREELEQFGIDVVSVMDAHFDSELQNAQLDGIRLQKPDAVIAIPADDSRTREKFQELSKVSKLVFISNVPDGMSKNSYVSCVSVNESENGTNTGRMLGEYCKENKKKKAGFIIHGAAFYGTRVRDNAAERIIKDSYPDIDIVTIRSFGEISNAYQVAKDVITANPEIEAMYVSWDRPALLAIKALKELGREDVAVFTTDLDHGIARCMEEGIVKGLSTQRPYEQGRAAAAVVAKSLVSEEQLPKYVGVQPYQVEPKQLRLAWKEIFHESMPDRLG